jgi:hypothetical protein
MSSDNRNRLDASQTAEHRRLQEASAGNQPWKRWGPYLSERQWGTECEDFSENGDAWNDFSHDQARSRAYRWGEDGLAGIALALGHKAGTDIGFAMGTVSARRPFLLYLTNIFGIVLSAALIFYLQYFRRQASSLVPMILIGGCLLFVIPPLGVSMDNLLVRNLVHRSLTVKTQELVLADRDVRFSNLSIRFKRGMAYIRADLIAAPGVLNQEVVDSIRGNISEVIEMPVILEFSIIPETVVRSTAAFETSE